MNLSELRKKKNISQEELANALGITQGAVSAYETGRWEPSITTIKKMASILDCTVDELLKDPKEGSDGE
jgi:transcriptional regulator with XRE-family HTH domain